ncbi:MAG TPA: hypothetical protein DCE42_23700 [Myxococcales bacterium]|nr:hypothetical protein [Deltaproteobacteria bacterium]MBU53129.1 hypothetical protein [Deltaproteobacteria bacterium]HAA57792.1 hypothetical protein [Myxococcales bacterium]
MCALVAKKQTPAASDTPSQKTASRARRDNKQYVLDLANQHTSTLPHKSNMAHSVNRHRTIQTPSSSGPSEGIPPVNNTEVKQQARPYGIKTQNSDRTLALNHNRHVEAKNWWVFFCLTWGFCLSMMLSSWYKSHNLFTKASFVKKPF